MRPTRDDRIVVVSPEGARDIVKAPMVFEHRTYPERIELQGRAYAYVGTQEGTPVYRAEGNDHGL
jgi:hypothetical protein